MAAFRLRRTDYGATVKNTDVYNGFTVRDQVADPTITIGTPTTTNNTDVRLTSSGDGKVTLS